MKVILVLAALGLALATAFALAARLWWAFDLFSHFRLQYLVLALAFALAALLLRSWPLVAAFALIACIHSFALRDLWLGGHTAAAAGRRNFRYTHYGHTCRKTPQKVMRI